MFNQLEKCGVIKKYNDQKTYFKAKDDFNLFYIKKILFQQIENMKLQKYQIQN